MSQIQLTRSTKSLFTLFLLASLQISLLNGHPLSTVQNQQGQGTPPCESTSNQSPECTSVSSPPAPPSCSAHQNEWDGLTTIEQYLAKCNLDEVEMKNDAGTLKYNDIVNCYRPHCNGDQYIAKQCSYNFPHWCWCSTPEGQALPNTFQKKMPDGYCSTVQQHCEVDGKDYDIGSVFTPPSVCGFCECHLNGTHTCINYTVDANGQLSNVHLEIFKKDLIQAFKLQHNQMLVDVQQIHKMSPAEVSDNERNAILSSKFISYDADEDDALNHFEEFKFHDELTKLFGCTEFYGHLNELMDSNQDGEISLQEWNTFFGVLSVSVDMSGDSPTTQPLPQKREAPLDIRRPLHLRKKFHYVIS